MNKNPTAEKIILTNNRYDSATDFLKNMG